MHRTVNRRERRTCRAPWSSLHREKRPWLSPFVSPRILATVPEGTNASSPSSSADQQPKHPGAAPTSSNRQSSFNDRQSPPWPAFWQRVQTELRKVHFQTGTLKVYRQVLRQFSVVGIPARHPACRNRQPGRQADAHVPGFAVPGANGRSSEPGV